MSGIRTTPLGLSPWLTVLLLPLLLAGCGGANGGEKALAGADDEDLAVPVEVAEVTLGSVSAAYEGTTTLEAEQEADVVAKVGGVVLELLLDEGDRVEKGQVVARLDRERLALELRQARSELARLEANIRRLEELIDRKLVSQDEYDRVRFDLERERARVALAELEYGYTDVRAPISGVISERLVKVGKLVERNEALFRIDDFDPLLAVLFAPEAQLNTLAIGQEARLSFDAIAGVDFAGVLERISPVVDPATGTFKVTVELADPDPRLKPGMFGRVRIVHDVHAQALMVPKSALIIEDRGTFVFVVEDGVVRRQQIRTGYSAGDRIEVLDGLQHGVSVVTSGKGSLSDGARIDVIPPVATAMIATIAT